MLQHSFVWGFCIELFLFILFDVDIMAPKSKVERSEHFNEIVDLLLAGESNRSVANYLENEYGESISHATIARYRKNNLNVTEAVNNEMEKKKLKAKVNEEVEKKEKAQSAFENAVANGVGVRELLQIIISDGDMLWRDLLRDPEVKSDVKVKLVMQAMREEREWIKEEPGTEVNVNMETDTFRRLADAFKD